MLGQLYQNAFRVIEIQLISPLVHLNGSLLILARIP